MSFKLITNKITWQGHVATTLPLSSFLGASSVERIFHQCCLVFDLWNSWKNLLLSSKKVKRKNQIPEYHVLSPKRLIRMIHEQSIDKKPPNPVRYWGGKSKDPKYVWWKTSQPWWEMGEENRKICEVWLVKKSPNLIRY